MNKYLCICAAIIAVCSADLYGGRVGGGVYGNDGYGSRLGGLQYQLRPRASLTVIPGYGVGPRYGGGLGLGYGRGIGRDIYGGLRVPGISNLGLAKTALNLPTPGVGHIPPAPAVLSTLSEPLIGHGIQYGGLPSVARSANAAAASSSVRSHAPIAIPTVTVPRSILGVERSIYGGGIGRVY